ncbi:MAG TPA: NAD(P)H-dependent oxidoreductase [Verrucomicrobiae bacterium]|nr:NAD(P)H-dependent oxidoreductase [Verrucomicrobiae bacterium]
MSHKPVANETLIKQLEWRYATKKFDPARKISAADWDTLERALVLTPSSYGLQPWKFVVITNQAVKESLVAASYRQTQPATCSHHVAFAAHREFGEAHVDRYLDRIVEVRGGSRENLAGLRTMLLKTRAETHARGHLTHWSAAQIYIALGNFMTTAALLGIDTSPMEGIQPAKYDELLGLAGTEYTTVVACAAGYRSPDCKYSTLPKVRFKTEDVVTHID